MEAHDKRAGKGAPCFSPRLSLYTVSQAVGTDKSVIAIEQVLRAFKPYITSKSMVTTVDVEGAVTEEFDEELARSLLATLIEAITDFKAPAKLDTLN